MDTPTAKSLLLAFQSKMQPTKAPRSKKFSECITELFICTLVTGKVVNQSSFRGICAYLFSSDERFFNQKDQVIQAFATAIKTVWNDKNERSLFKDHFFRDLRAEFKLMKQNVERTEYLQEFNQLNEIQQNKNKKKQEEIFSKSLFHATPAVSSIFDFNQLRATLFKDIFSHTEEAFINTKELFLQFLRARPIFAGHEDMVKRNELIDKALTSDSELTDSMTKTFKAFHNMNAIKKFKIKPKSLPRKFNL